MALLKRYDRGKKNFFRVCLEANLGKIFALTQLIFKNIFIMHRDKKFNLQISAFQKVDFQKNNFLIYINIYQFRHLHSSSKVFHVFHKFVFMSPS